VSKEVADAIEAVSSQLAEAVGQIHGAELAPAEALVAIRGDFLVALGYAALFFPSIRLESGVPYARFATATSEEVLDFFHVDLLHHSSAGGRDPSVLTALGTALAEAWCQALERQGLPGRFAYRHLDGFYVVYEP
jgi:hypothetical protein